MPLNICAIFFTKAKYLKKYNFQIIFKYNLSHNLFFESKIVDKVHIFQAKRMSGWDFLNKFDFFVNTKYNMRDITEKKKFWKLKSLELFKTMLLVEEIEHLEFNFFFWNKSLFFFFHLIYFMTIPWKHLARF